MSAASMVWRAHARSLGNAARQDRRNRWGLITLLFVGVATGRLAIPRLALLMEHWQAQGVFAARLWLLYGSVWLALAAIAALNTAPFGFGMAEARVLWTLPIASATRFRALWGVVLLEGLWSVLLLQSAVVGGALAATLGWQALGWLWTLIAGGGVAAWCGVVGVLVLRGITHWRKRFGLAALLVCGVLLMGGLIKWFPVMPSPLWVGGALNIALVLLFGPCAEVAGRLYEGAFLAAQHQNRTRSHVYVPGAAHLSAWLLRRRSVASALLRKGLLSRGRSKLNLVRFTAPVLYLALFPLVGALAAQRGIDMATVVGGFATALVLLMASETVPSPFGGEGNRLFLLLAMPLRHGALLWAKWTAWTVPVLGYGVVLSLVLGVWCGLPVLDLLATLAGTVLVLLGNAAIWVWGSAWDVDLDATVIGPEQTMLVEELPLTAWRMVLIGGNVVFAGAAWALFWMLPSPVALPLLAVVDVLVYLVAWRLGLAALGRLMRHA